MNALQIRNTWAPPSTAPVSRAVPKALASESFAGMSDWFNPSNVESLQKISTSTSVQGFRADRCLQQNLATGLCLTSSLVGLPINLSLDGAALAGRPLETRMNENNQMEFKLPSGQIGCVGQSQGFDGQTSLDFLLVGENVSVRQAWNGSQSTPYKVGISETRRMGEESNMNFWPDASCPETGGRLQINMLQRGLGGCETTTADTRDGGRPQELQIDAKGNINDVSNDYSSCTLAAAVARCVLGFQEQFPKL